MFDMHGPAPKQGGSMYYKVVRRDRDGNAISSFAKGEWQVIYSTEEPVEANTGLLWIYEHSDDGATRYSSEFTCGTELWECEATEVQTLACAAPLYQGDWEDFWNDLESYPRKPHPSMRLAQTVLLTRLVARR